MGRALGALVLLAATLVVVAAPAADAAKRPARADLGVASASVRLVSGRVTVALVAANRGRRAAAPSAAMVTWKPVGSPVVTVLRRFQVPALRPGSRRAATVAAPVPAGASGAYAVTVCLNVRRTVREANRADNCRAVGRVTVPASGALGEVRTSTPVATGPAVAPAAPGGSTPGPDTLAPDTTIGRGPVGTTNSRTETILFSASEGGGTFECRLDEGAWGPCVSPVVLTALADGGHTFEVRATDAAGNSDATPAARSWTVDATPPDTLITSGPAARVSTTAVSVAFEGSEHGTGFQCKLDGGLWTDCASPHEITGLAAGVHTFQVRAYDAAGTPDPTPATRAWTVDLTEPQTTIASGPSGVTTGPATAFTFTSEPGATFECRLDGGLWAPCTSPASLTGLADGAHTFAVRAVDAAGNPDTSPAERSWTVDATAPETTIDSGPADTVATADATFAMSASEAGSTFACRLDGGVWEPCTSPVTFSGLADGEHTFEVAATDTAGNAEATPATWTWTVAVPPPAP